MQGNERSKEGNKNSRERRQELFTESALRKSNDVFLINQSSNENLYPI